MDQRQTKIVEGAGLEESRLNVEFIDWLQKWGTPILMVVCLIAAAYAGRTWWKRSQANAHDTAYVELYAAVESGSPDNMLRVAREHGSRGAVAALANLAAADAYLRAAVLRVQPGGSPNIDADKASDEQRALYLEQARTLYAAARDAAGTDRAKAIHAVNASFGLAAALATSGEFDAARQAYAAAADSARTAGFADLIRIAEERAADLPTAPLPPLPSADAVKAAARPLPPSPEPAPIAPFSPAPAGPAPEQAQPAAPEPAPTPEPTPAPQPTPESR